MVEKLYRNAKTTLIDRFRALLAHPPDNPDLRRIGHRRVCEAHPAPKPARTPVPIWLTPHGIDLVLLQRAATSHQIHEARLERHAA